MQIEPLVSNRAILTELGHRLSQRRLELHYTQSELARQAGISKRTLERLEKEGTTQMSTLIRVLRILELLPTLDRLIPSHKESPITLLRQNKPQRQRTSSSSKQSVSEESWHWDDKT